MQQFKLAVVVLVHLSLTGCSATHHLECVDCGDDEDRPGAIGDDSDLDPFADDPDETGVELEITNRLVNPDLILKQPCDLRPGVWPDWQDQVGLDTGLFDLSLDGCSLSYELLIRIRTLAPALQFVENRSPITIELTLTDEAGTLLPPHPLVDPVAYPNPIVFEGVFHPMTLLDRGHTRAWISHSYAPMFQPYIDKTIFVRARLTGQIVDRDDNLQDFDVLRPAFPIEICDGCLTVCLSEQSPGDTDDCTTREKAQDGRLCYDPDC